MGQESFKSKSESRYLFCVVDHSKKVQPVRPPPDSSRLAYFLPHGKGRVYDFDIIRCFNRKHQCQTALHYIVSCEEATDSSEGGKIYVYGIPNGDDGQGTALRKFQALQTIDMVGANFVKVRTHVRIERDESMVLNICAADTAGNIHFWENFEQSDIIFSAHTKAITDIQWIPLKSYTPSFDVATRTLPFSHFVATTSLDGSVKVWDYKLDNFVPIYEHFASRKWVHSLYFDASINALFFNQEGKNCPQKILYFRPYQYDLPQGSQGLARSADSPPDEDHRTNGPHHGLYESEKLVLRQYKLFNETILKTSSYVCNDFAYVCGTNGVIYKLAKKDACRLIHKQKEKLKGSLAKKLVQI